RPFAGGGLQYTGGQRDVNYRSALAATGAAGVRQRLPYGGEVVAEGLVSFVNALSDSAQSGESAELVLSGSIPLLRGAGLVNLEGVISSERELVYAVRDFERFRREFAVNVSAAYFRLLSRQARVNNRRINLANTTQLLDRTKALYAAGRQRFIEVQRAAGQVLTAENALITAQELYRNELDDFKVLLGMAVDTELDIVPVQLDVRVPDIANQDVLALANTYRLDLQTAKDRIEDARRAIANAENALLPELNLAGRTSVGNRPQTPAARLDGRSLEYQAGVTLDLPVDRVAERNAYRRATIAFQRATRQFDGERDNAAADVRAAARGIRAAEATVQIQERAVGVATNRLEYANELLRQGAPNITARDVVEAQTALLTAQDALDEARADLQTEILRYLRDTGTLRLDPQAGAIARALERDPANNPPATP
ncbi:MAG TPA: TolC family protein, partial [Tepidisphaeraceae bacterium]|nr:TolC family protein [Tepidisphaeraceae bacterium]